MTCRQKHVNKNMNSNIDTEAGIARLKEEQEKSLNVCNQSINQWTQFENDYKRLHNFLGTVGNKLKHDVMVPFGKLAFMPGQLVNTNNVLALLGDNWFVECSTRQAQGIVERRINSCQDMLKKMEAEKGQAQGWIQHTESALGEEGLKEIIEEYDPVRDVSWRDRRMQRQSNLNNINNNNDDGGESDKKGDFRSRNARIRWEDQEQKQSAVISFTHSSRTPPDSLQFKTNSNLQTVSSPGDIWNVFGSPTTEQKSILKPTKPSVVSSDKNKEDVKSRLSTAEQNTLRTARPSPVAPSNNVEENVKQKQPSEMSSQAFTGSIVEKLPTDVLDVHKEAPSRPISRFKARRSKK